MDEKNNNNHYLSIKDVFSESLLRDLILFIFMFILIIAQGWGNIFFLSFPLITFTFSLFFRILSSKKSKSEFKNSLIVYNPFGFERNHANRFFFCTLFQLILIFWLGGESLYNSLIVQNYFPFFLECLIFLYTFSFFWIFINSWKNTKIEIILDTSEPRSSSQVTKDLRNIISSLKWNNYRIIIYISFFVFILLNIINIISLFFIDFISVGIQLVLPGSQIMSISYFFILFLIISPTISIIFLIRTYRDISNINTEKLNEILKPLPRNIQIKIIENLKVLNDRIKEQLKNE